MGILQKACPGNKFQGQVSGCPSTIPLRGRLSPMLWNCFVPGRPSLMFADLLKAVLRVNPSVPHEKIRKQAGIKRWSWPCPPCHHPHKPKVLSFYCHFSFYCCGLPGSSREHRDSALQIPLSLHPPQPATRALIRWVRRIGVQETWLKGQESQERDWLTF